MSYSEQIAGKLNELLEKNFDAEAGYKEAKEQVKSTALKGFFDTQSQERYNFGHELKAEIKNLGDKPEKGTSLAGDAHRAWMNVKSTFSSNNDEAVLEEAIRGEKAALENYNEIINDNEVPQSIRNVISSHRDRIHSALNSVETLEKDW